MLSQTLIVNSISLNVNSESLQYILIFIALAAVSFWMHMKKMGVACIFLAGIIPALIGLLGSYSYPTELMQSYGIYLPFHEIRNYMPLIIIGGVVLGVFLMMGRRSSKEGGIILIITIGVILGFIAMYFMEAVFFIRLLDSSQVIAIELELAAVLILVIVVLIIRKKKNDEKNKGKETIKFKTYFSTPASYYRLLTVILLFAHIGWTFITRNIYISIFVALVSTFAFIVAANAKMRELMQDTIGYITKNMNNYLAKLKNMDNQAPIDSSTDSLINTSTEINSNIEAHGYDSNSNIDGDEILSDNTVPHTNNSAAIENSANLYDGDELFAPTAEFFDSNPEDENPNANNEIPINLINIPQENNQNGDEHNYNQSYRMMLTLLKRFIVELFINNRIDLNLDTLDIIDCVEKVSIYFNTFSYLELPDLNESLEKFRTLERFIKNNGTLSEDLLNGAESNCVEMKRIILESLTLIIKDNKFDLEDGA